MEADFWEFSAVPFACSATEDFFRSRIDHMIDLHHPLAVLASRMPWQQIEASVSHLLSRKGRAGEPMPDLDLFGEQLQRAAAPSNAGRPRVPLRVMISLLYLKHAFGESDEGVVERWADTPRWQFFSGCAYYEDRQPCDASTLVKFRQLLGEEGVEELLAQTIQVAVDLKLIKAQELTRVIVDTTVQPKAVAHPTDSRLLETARAKLVQAATLVCMGHEPTLRAELELAAKPFKIDVEVVDILRDKADLEFKRDSQAKVAIKKGELVIEKFYPMNLLQKLSLQKEAVDDWKELAESVLIDWNYDGAVLQPAVVDIPGKNELVKGTYQVPDDAGTIRVKITDLLSESWEGSVANGD